MSDFFNFDLLVSKIADEVESRIKTNTARQLPKLWDAKEIADYLHIKPDAVRVRMRAGEFGSLVNVGDRKHLVTQEGLEEYIRKNTCAYTRYEHIKERRTTA